MPSQPDPASAPEPSSMTSRPHRVARHGAEGASLKRVCTGLLVFYGVALAFNAGALHANNVRLPYGPSRSFWMTLSAPVAQVFAALRFDRPRAWLEQRLGGPLNAP